MKAESLNSWFFYQLFDGKFASFDALCCGNYNCSFLIGNHQLKFKK